MGHCKAQPATPTVAIVKKLPFVSSTRSLAVVREGPPAQHGLRAARPARALCIAARCRPYMQLHGVLAAKPRYYHGRMGRASPLVAHAPPESCSTLAALFFCRRGGSSASRSCFVTFTFAWARGIGTQHGRSGLLVTNCMPWDQLPHDVVEGDWRTHLLRELDHAPRHPLGHVHCARGRTHRAHPPRRSAPKPLPVLHDWGSVCVL